MTKKILLFAFLFFFIATLSWGIEVVRQKNAATYIVFPIVNADGDFVESAAGLDSEIDSWADGSTPDGFADCSNEATEIGGGIYYLSLTQDEMNVDYAVIKCSTTTSGAKKQMILIRTITGDPLNLATPDSTIIDVSSAYDLRATGFATSTQGDSLTNAITATNKANFKATGFAVSGDPMTLQGDSLAGLFGDVGNLDGWDPIIDNDSLVVDQSTMRWDLAGGGTTDTSKIKSLMQNNWDADTDGELSVETSTGADSAVMKTMIQNNWDSDTDGLLSVEAGAGGADTSDIKTMLQQNWDSDTDGELSVELPDSTTIDMSNAWPLISGIKAKTDSSSYTAAGFIKSTPQTDVTVNAASQISIAANCSTYNQAMIQKNWDTDDDALLAVENPTDSVTIDNSNAWSLITENFIFDNDSVVVDQSTMRWDLAGGGSDTATIKTMLQNNWDDDTDGLLAVEDSVIIDLSHGWPLRGETAGLDTTTIKTMITNNFDSDQDGYLRTESSEGTRTVVIQTQNAADSVGISAYKLDVYDSTSGEPKRQLKTNVSGVCTLSLDDATYRVALQKTPWSITSPVYPIITSDTTLTYYATAFDPGSPAAANLCRLYILKVTDLGANSLAGCELHATIPAKYLPIVSANGLVSHYEVTAMSNDTGYVYLDVYRSSELTAADGTSTVKFDLELFDSSDNSLVRRKDVEIPDSTSWEIDWTP